MNKIRLILTVILTVILFNIASSYSYSAIIPGRAMGRPQLSCAAYNGSPYFLQILGVQFQYTCQDVFSGMLFSYGQYVPCAYGCSFPAYTQQWINGPVAFNCNMVSATCQFVTAP